jgi:hypothetical protein
MNIKSVVSTFRDDLQLNINPSPSPTYHILSNSPTKPFTFSIMKTSCLIASLAAAVSAIDIRLWVSSSACQDSGAAAVCTGWNPNVTRPDPSPRLQEPLLIYLPPAMLRRPLRQLPLRRLLRRPPRLVPRIPRPRRRRLPQHQDRRSQSRLDLQVLDQWRLHGRRVRVPVEATRYRRGLGLRCRRGEGVQGLPEAGSVRDCGWEEAFSCGVVGRADVGGFRAGC